MSDLQSNNPNTEAFERGEVSVHSIVSQKANIILNHDFSGGLQFWHANCCYAHVASGVSDHLTGAAPHLGETYYSVVTNRTECWQGLEQDITGRVSIGMKYDVSAFVRVHGNLDGLYEAQATLRLENSDSSVSYLFIGRKTVKKDGWEKLKGSFTLTSLPRRVVFYLEGPPPGMDMLIDSVIASLCASGRLPSVMYAFALSITPASAFSLRHAAFLCPAYLTQPRLHRIFSHFSLLANDPSSFLCCQPPQDVPIPHLAANSMHFKPSRTAISSPLWVFPNRQPSPNIARPSGTSNWERNSEMSNTSALEPQPNLCNCCPKFWFGSFSRMIGPRFFHDRLPPALLRLQRNSRRTPDGSATARQPYPLRQASAMADPLCKLFFSVS
ncbi:hypothetical protein KSP40_PGU022508 [Platanthera guangdongensis]|uniref:CBM-cenC domain-containing protein n=1 Tax=Platanthera guangdongensis TaxID=2320717 RepID=A0ABR2MYW4_9ASPA